MVRVADSCRSWAEVLGLAEQNSSHRSGTWRAARAPYRRRGTERSARPVNPPMKTRAPTTMSCWSAVGSVPFLRLSFVCGWVGGCVAVVDCSFYGDVCDRGPSESLPRSKYFNLFNLLLFNAIRSPTKHSHARTRTPSTGPQPQAIPNAPNHSLTSCASR